MLTEILVPIACGCILPIVVIWLSVREKMNESKNRTQIVLAAIEKNPDMDLEELMKKISLVALYDCPQHFSQPQGKYSLYGEHRRSTSTY